MPSLASLALLVACNAKLTVGPIGDDAGVAIDATADSAPDVWKDAERAPELVDGAGDGAHGDVGDGAVDGTADADGIVESGPCAVNQVLEYLAPGCGSVPTRCRSALDDACLGPPMCGCDGYTFLSGCGGWADRTYVSSGACPSEAGEAGGD